MLAASLPRRVSCKPHLCPPYPPHLHPPHLHPPPSSPQLVFIGKGLDEDELAESFNRCLATEENLARRRAALRFAVGDQVEFCVGPMGFVDATITDLMVREDDMPPGLVAPYEIQRHDEQMGYVTWADLDTDRYVRRKSTAPPADSADAHSADAHSADAHSADAAGVIRSREALGESDAHRGHAHGNKAPKPSDADEAGSLAVD